MHTETAKKQYHRTMKTNKQERRQLLRWKRRSFKFKLAHRLNVLTAWFQGLVSTRSLLCGLRWPHMTVALPIAGQRGMVLVCPDALETMFGKD